MNAKILTQPPTHLSVKFNFSTKIDKTLFCFNHSACSIKISSSLLNLLLTKMLRIWLVESIGWILETGCNLSWRKLYSINQTRSSQSPTTCLWENSKWCLTIDVMGSILHLLQDSEFASDFDTIQRFHYFFSLVYIKKKK